MINFSESDNNLHFSFLEQHQGSIFSDYESVIILSLIFYTVYLNLHEFHIFFQIILVLPMNQGFFQTLWWVLILLGFNWDEAQFQIEWFLEDSESFIYKFDRVKVNWGSTEIHHALLKLRVPKEALITAFITSLGSNFLYVNSNRENLG